MASKHKSEALSRKKEEKATDNTCKHCGKMHKTSEHNSKPDSRKKSKQEKETEEVEREEGKE